MNLVRQICCAAIVLLLTAAPLTWAQDDEFSVKVASGDNLFGLVRLHYPNSPSRWSLIENEIFLANPHGFSNNNKSLLRVGAVLKFPVYDAPKTEEPPEEPQAAEPGFSLVEVGTTMQLSGSPLAIDINNQQRFLTLKSNIYVGDIILTEGGSAARLQMNDGAQLYVRANSRLVIEQYSFLENAPQSNRSIIRLLKGGFRAISGLIGRRNPAAVSIMTTVATIGVRGTDFAVRICEPDECSLPEQGVFAPGDYSGVLDGEITITNDAGTVPVAFGEVVRTESAEKSPVPAPEAAGLIFTAEELVLLKEKNREPMNFFQWLRSQFFRNDAD